MDESRWNPPLIEVVEPNGLEMWETGLPCRSNGKAHDYWGVDRSRCPFQLTEDSSTETIGTISSLDSIMTWRCRTRLPDLLALSNPSGGMDSVGNEAWI